MSKYLDEVGVKYMWNKTTSYVDEKTSQIKEGLTSIYHWKGTVATIEDLKALPKETLSVGDCYNVKSSGMNYGWTEEPDNPDYDEGWDPLGGIIEIPTLTIEDIDKLLTEG